MSDGCPNPEPKVTISRITRYAPPHPPRQRIYLSNHSPRQASSPKVMGWHSSVARLTNTIVPVAANDGTDTTNVLFLTPPPAPPPAASVQGLKLVHFSAQRKRVLWDRGCIQGVVRGRLRGARGC